MARCLICFLSCLFIVECYQGRTGRADVSFDKLHGHEYNVQKFYSNLIVKKKAEEQCQSKDLTKLLRQVKCVPRETVVHLTSALGGFQILTDKILVNRCQEIGCYGINSCVPIKTRHVRVPVLLWGKGQCAWIEVTEHTACGCKCSITSEHCNIKQEYLPDQCACRCRNKAEKNACRGDGKKWDEKTCSCVCPAEWMDCSTGTEWVPRMCKCVRVMTQDNYEKYLMF